MTILLVDDDEIDRESVQRHLRTGDWNVISADSAETALQHLRADDGEIQGVLLDFRLPDRDGLDVLEEIRAFDVPVIMLTGEGNEKVAVEAMKLGAEDYLPKNGLRRDALQKSILNAVEKARLKKELAERHAEQEAFAMVVSHDLRSPMASLMMFMEAIRHAATSGDQEFLEDITTKAEQLVKRLSDMIQNLHEYSVSGLQEKDPEEIDFNQVIEDVIGNLTGPIQECGAEIVVQKGFPVIQGDSTGIQQLMGNLVSNAIKYRKPDQPLKIELFWEKIDGGGCRIAVRDSGIGIDQEAADQVFKPFFRVRSKDIQVGGSGLGLALCARVVQQHGGRIHVKSAPGEGSTFYVEFPESGQSYS